MSEAASEFAPLLARYAMEPPQPWPQMYDAGMFDLRHLQHVQLSDLSWLSLSEMVTWRFPDDEIPGLFPFAASQQDDVWCWRPDWQHADGIPVVYCPHEDEVAVAYAPNFEAFLYRACLEEYACTCLTDFHAPGKSQAILGNYAERLQRFLRPAWAEELARVAAQPLQELEHGYFGTINADEAETIWRRDLDFWPLLDTEFAHFLGN